MPNADRPGSSISPSEARLICLKFQKHKSGQKLREAEAEAEFCAFSSINTANRQRPLFYHSLHDLVDSGTHSTSVSVLPQHSEEEREAVNSTETGEMLGVWMCLSSKATRKCFGSGYC